MSAPSTISIDKLIRLIGTPKCPLLVDVRPQDDFEADPHLIPSAFHCAFDRLEDRIETDGGQSAIVICQKGSDVSQGARLYSGITAFQRKRWKEVSKHGGRRGFR
jgi:rhodanese-related sulfurtransferase